MKHYLLAAALLAASCARGPSAAADGAPKRVVFVLVDTLRYDHLGRAGDPRGLTPRLDALAAEGAWFPHALAASSWTRPSVTSMFTGLHPGSHGVEDGDDGLAPDLPTLAQLLAASGVNCLAVSANANGGRAFGLDRGFAEFRVPLERRGYPDDFEKIPGDVVMKKGLELLEQVGERESFFLFLHMIDPHDPYLEHPGLLGGDGPPGRFAGSRRDLKRLGTTDPAALTEDDYERIRWLYAGEVRFADQCIGELLDALAARGWLDDTLVIVTSDHGEELWNHGRRAHGQSLYQELVHVPLILRPPPALGLGGRTVERLAHHVDLMPTILSYFGVPAPLGIAGADLMPAVAGAAHEAPAYVVSQLQHEGVTLECATDFRLKRILEPEPATGAPREELYDLAADPGEHAPLQDPPPVRFAALREFHAGMLDQIARARVEGVTLPWTELGEEVRAELAGLGYAGD
jgi:choline-sulfatase